MMRGLWVLSLVLLVTQLHKCRATTNSVKFYCLRGDSKSVNIQLEIWNTNAETPITHVAAVDQDTNQPIAACSSDNHITGTGTLADPMKLKVVVTDPTIDDTTDIACGHKTSGNMVYTWVFRITTSTPVTIPGLTFGSDGDETFVCEFDPVLNPVIADAPTVANAPSAIERETVTPVVEEIQLKIAHPTTYAKITQAQFASEAIIHLQLLPSATGTAVGLTGVNCLACPTSACDTDTVQIIDANGCEVSSQGIFESSSYSGFFSKRDQSANIGAETVYSNIFKVFRFSQGDFVYFKCSVLYCYTYNPTTGNQYCDDHCTHSGAGRRRRSSDSDTKEQYSVTVIRVPRGRHPNDTDLQCIHHTGSLITIPSLAVASVIGSASAFVSCALLHKAMKSRRKQASK